MSKINYIATFNKPVKLDLLDVKDQYVVANIGLPVGGTLSLTAVMLNPDRTANLRCGSSCVYGVDTSLFTITNKED